MVYIFALKCISDSQENKSDLYPILMENMGAGGYNVPLILTKYAIRKLTPKRWFLFQGYESDFKLPKRKAQSHLYKQAGNFVVITIIKMISKKYNL